MSTDDITPPGTAFHPSPAGIEAIWDHPLVRQVSCIGQRLRQIDRNRPWLLDAGVVVALIPLLCVPDLLSHNRPEEFDVDFTRLPWQGTIALQAGLVLPLLWRRRKPAPTFAVIVTVFLVECALGVWLRAGMAALIALYHLALHGRLRHLPVACAMLGLALGLVALRLRGELSIVDGLFFLGTTVVAAVALGLAVRVRRAQLAALHDRAARLEIERDQRSQLAAAAERTRVAREMHDIVGHNLSVIITLADGGARAADITPERGKQALLMIGDTGRQAMGELRRTLGLLRDHHAASDTAQLSPQPRLADIDALCARIRAAGPQVVYRTSGELDSLDRGVQLTVYRIVQEALTNALKHAGRDTRIDLTVTAREMELRIDVQDTGPGPGATRPEHPRDQGQGLTGMRERAALYNGTVTAGPAPGGGWAVRVALDLTPITGLPRPAHAGGTQ
ncbi:sensor histidine kinase [Streptomyces sp. A012304]|uniref:sensor histidine kinase n=1 Tax=Streptomyces sp. A012304 TaxID=375446 RepID=UPI0022302A1D|nr:sensor histidine kinase [Streptomyces sp. A012304]GKQ39183.1 two-component sensor histidine kinase [Streptomyces sp. A012304]